jgi:hypothetical protein
MELCLTSTEFPFFPGKNARERVESICKRVGTVMFMESKLGEVRIFRESKNLKIVLMD